jgi:hypothetical protein
LSFFGDTKNGHIQSGFPGISLANNALKLNEKGDWMKKQLLLSMILVLCVCVGLSQAEGTVGFLFKSGSISSVGMSFDLSKRLTLRPSFGFRSSTTETLTDYLGGSDITRTHNLYNLNLGLFYHFLKKKDLSVYTGLELGYSHEKVENESCLYGVCATLADDFDGYNGNLILGLRYKLNKHLAIFGEMSLGYQRYEGTDAIQGQNFDLEVKYNYWDLGRSGFGIILYL